MSNVSTIVDGQTNTITQLTMVTLLRVIPQNERRESRKRSTRPTHNNTIIVTVKFAVNNSNRTRTAARADVMFRMASVSNTT
jgi:hypothetical protein